MSPNMTASFSRVLALALVVLAVNTTAIQFAIQYSGCTNSDDGSELSSIFLASACQLVARGISLDASCSNNEFKVFNSTDCTGTVLQTFSNTCAAPPSSLIKMRAECENVNDAEYIRTRAYFATNGQTSPDCDTGSTATSFTRLNKCYDFNTNSFKFTKLNATAYTKTEYTAVGCNSANEAQTLTIDAAGTCDLGFEVDFILAGDVGNSSGLVRISGHILSFVLTVASILVML